MPKTKQWRRQIGAALVALATVSMYCAGAAGADDNAYVERFRSVQGAAHAVAPARQAQATSGTKSFIDAPGLHGMFMIGRDTLFLVHMPMFTEEKHMYDVVLRASLPPDIMTQYQALRDRNPSRPYNLINVDTFTLPQIKSGAVRQFKATIFDGFSNEGDGTPGPVLFDNVQVTVDEAVYFRHFDFDLSPPAEMTYMIFGRDGEAHLTHFLSRDPDFQHIVTLPSPPDWLSQDQLRAGVTLNVIGKSSAPIPCSEPLTEVAYQVRFAGRQDATAALTLKHDGTVWLSSRNLLNLRDPCEQH